MVKMNLWDKIASALVVAGAVNWLTIAFWKFNFVEWLAMNTWLMLDNIVYGAVGLAGAYAIARFVYIYYKGK